MKTILNYILITCIITGCFCSCEDFLNEKVISGVSYDYLETKEGLETAINGVYQTMRWYVGGENYYALNEYGVDYVWEGADGGHRDAMNKYGSQLNPSMNLLYDFWKNNYNGINRANTALMFLPAMAEMSDEVKQSREGELRFLRAYFYFDLVQHFGPIPLLEEANISEIITDFKRSSIADVYKFIISDLRVAYDKLPASQNQRGRVTQGAAAHLLSKVYLTRGSAVNDQRGQLATDIDSTIYFANKVIDSNLYVLETDYSTTTDIVLQKNSKETIWAVEFTEDVLFNGDGNKLHLYWIPTYENIPGLQRDIEQGRAWKRVRPTPYYQTELYDQIADSRIYKSFKWIFWANREATIPKWQEHYYYVDENGRTTDEIIYSPPTELVGQPKFSMGDTAALFVPVYYGAKDRTGAVIDAEKNRQMQIDIAKSRYTLYPVDENTNHFYPCLLKWLDPNRPNANYEAGSRNFVRMRLAETYLILAEAYGRKQEYQKAAEYINIIRTRAAYKTDEEKPMEWTTFYGGDPALITASTVDQMKITATDISGDFIGFILDERSREMFGEMNRWEDLVRTETLVERVKKFNPDAAGNIKEHHKLRPIPQNHIDRLSPIPELSEAQNPGYY